MYRFILGLLMSLLICTSACVDAPQNQNKVASEQVNYNEPSRTLTKAFKKYWFAGDAEISSFTLTQSRYGELRSGDAVLIYVTEDFLPNIQVKANNPGGNSIKVLKLNATKNFNTGIYPYSIMQSTFQPVYTKSQPLKISASIQEWCGHVYAQINRKGNTFKYTGHSYFEGEADTTKDLLQYPTENEIWTTIRLNPKELPQGNFKMIPALEYLSLKHKNNQAYNANGELINNEYRLFYPELNRKLIITFNSNFPYEILKWEEHFQANQEQFMTKAVKKKTIKSPYWQKNKNKDSIWRKTLHLK